MLCLSAYSSASSRVHLPLAHRGDDLQIGGERLEGDVEADLVVALAGAAVGDGLGLVLVGGIDHELGDERPAQRGRQRILALVHGAGHQGRQDEAIDEQVAGVDGDGVDRPGLHGLLLDLLDVLALAEVDREGDHVEVVLLADPRHHDGGVEAAAIRQDDLVACHCSVLKRKNCGARFNVPVSSGHVGNVPTEKD